MTAVTTQEFSAPADTGVRPQPARPAARQLSREELEALASKFVQGNTPAPAAVRAPSRAIWIAGVTGMAVTVALIGSMVVVDTDDSSKSNAAAESVTAPVEDWAAKLEAERRKHREQLERSSKYMEKMAAAEEAALKDFQKRAAVLAAASTASRSADEPGPIEGVAKSSASATSTKTQSAAPVERSAESKSQPPKAGSPATTPAPAAATAAPESASVIASKSSCRMHVSELSSSGTLTYEAVARIKGARINEETGNITLPPVDVPGRGSMIFVVMSDGCVRYRSAGTFGR